MPPNQGGIYKIRTVDSKRQIVTMHWSALKYPNQNKSNFLVTLQLFYSLKNRIYSPQINVRNSAQYLDQSSLKIEKYYV